jgi:hypothetical protein
MFCKDHAGRHYITNIGICEYCGGGTASGGHRICRKCAEDNNQCRVCLKDLGKAK